MKMAYADGLHCITDPQHMRVARRGRTLISRVLKRLCLR
jgi:hypothetical protein